MIVKKKKKKITGLISLALVLALAVAGGLAVRAVFGSSVRADEKGIAVYVPTGTTPGGLAELLRPHLHHTFLLGTMAEYAAREKGDVHAGKFILEDGMSTYEAVKMFFVGHGVEVSVRFNGTRGLESLAGTVARQIEADSVSLVAAFKDKVVLDSLGLDSLTVLSVFIPNTYYFYWNTSAEEFFERMLREYDRFWDDTRRGKAATEGMTPLQVSTLASIVQAETAKTDERPVVAGLYMNRLKKGIRLQSDPTVIYAMRLSGKYPEPIRRVYLSDLKIKSPFNTYINKGLPPAPVNIPDISSIDAVLDYMPHKYIYMCASVERFGYHEFSSSLSEHNKNRRKYIRWANENNVK